MSTFSKGRAAERFVVASLKKKGWKILECNYRYMRSEIDIIALDKKDIVFIEVKSGYYSITDLSELVNKRKRKTIEKVAQHFYYSKNMQNYSMRFDIILVSLPQYQLHHFRNEFFDE